jgi:predicted transcriptional regulator
MKTWKFITNYGIVLAYVAKHPDALAEDIAVNLGVRERTIRRIISELVADGYVEKERIGRSNRYRVNLESPLRRSIMRGAKVGDLLDTLIPLLEIQE